VITAFRHPREGFFSEDVHTAVDPLRKPRSLIEAHHEVITSEFNDAYRDTQRRYGNRGTGRALPVTVKQAAQVDIEQVVPIEDVDISFVSTLSRRVSNASSAAERLRLFDRDNVRSKPVKLIAEDGPLPGGAADEDPVDTRPDEESDMVSGEGSTCNANKRLRHPARRLSETFPLPSGD